MTQIYSSPCYLTTKSAPPTTHTYIHWQQAPTPSFTYGHTPWSRRGRVGGRGGRDSEAELLQSKASSCRIKRPPVWSCVVADDLGNPDQTDAPNAPPPRHYPSLSTVLFLIEHICGMRGLSPGGAMAADPSELLTQDQYAEKNCKRKNIVSRVMPL